MSRHDAVKEEWRMAGPPPDDKKIGGRGRRPGEFKPAGSRGDDPITRNLKRVYKEVEDEPIPDELLRLLGKLDERGGGNG